MNGRVTRISLWLGLLAGSAMGQFNFPGGRIAISHDGNNYDQDDFVAAPMNLALLEAAGMKSKLVYYDHSCHLLNKPEMYEEMLESVNGAVQRFKIDPSIVFDIQTQQDEAIAAFKIAAEKSDERNPLWFLCAGPMEMPWRCVNAVDPACRKFIYCVSHSSPFNEKHKKPDAGMTHDWDDLGALGVNLIRIKNQNKTEWNTAETNVEWMRDSDNPDLQWLYSRNAKKTYDSSDTGMTWWLLTGGPDGGNENGGWQDYKPLLEALRFEPVELPVPAKVSAETYYLEEDGLVVIEAEHTVSKLDLWVQKDRGLKNGHTGEGYLEFTGNNTGSGPATSPLEYAFRIEKPGLYYIHLYCARETVGDRKDVANDCYVRVEGDYGEGKNPGRSHGNDAPLAMLQKNTKFFGGDDLRLAWASGNRLDPGGHRNKRVAVYDFKAGERYKLVVSGRSQKFKLDRIVFRHESVEPSIAQDPARSESMREAGSNQ